MNKPEPVERKPSRPPYLIQQEIEDLEDLLISMDGDLKQTYKHKLNELYLELKVAEMYRDLNG